LSCEDCCAALHDCTLDTPDKDVCSLVRRKDRGGLKHYSSSVYKIISVTETIVNREIICLGKLPSTAHLRLLIEYNVLDNLSGYHLFPVFGEHFAFSVLVTGESHYLQLMKLIILKYINIRLKDYGKMFLLKHHFGNKQSTRMQANKLLLFQG